MISMDQNLIKSLKAAVYDINPRELGEVTPATLISELA